MHWKYWYADNDDCLQNENLITNFRIKQAPIYRKAIAEYGWDGLYISKNAYWRNGTKDPELYSLRWKTNERRDLSEFWKIFDKIYDRNRFII